MQTTISKPIFFEGIGLHTGFSSKIKVVPAGIDCGISFIRVDLKMKTIASCHFKKYLHELCTRLQKKGIVSTVEALDAALLSE